MAPRHPQPPRRARHHRSRRFALRAPAAAVLLVGLSLGAGLAVPPARAQATAPADGTARRFAIPAGPLGQVLNAFAATAGIELSADAALLEGLSSEGLSGSYTVEEGFERLLRGQHLQVSRSANGSYVLSRAAPRQATAPALPTVSVRARALGPDDLPPPYAGAQVARGARLGLLGNVDFMDAPFNQSSYTANLIADQQATTLADVIANDPAVRMNTRGRNTSSGGGDTFTIRGYNVGNQDVSFNGFYGVAPYGTVSTEAIERVEILKGPSALIAGMAPNGGVGGGINIVPKRAADEPLTRLTASYGSDAQFGAHLDLGRRFGEQRELGLRLNGAWRRGDTAVDAQSSMLGLAAVAIDYRSGGLRASVDFGSQDDDVKAPNSAFSLDPSLAALPSPPKGSDQTVQSWERRRFKDRYGIAQLEYDIGQQATVYGALGRRRHRNSNFRTEPTIVDPQGSLLATPVDYPQGSDTTSQAVGVRLSTATGPVAHRIHAGFSRTGIEAGFGYRWWPEFGSSLYRPNPIATPQPAVADGFSDLRKAYRRRLSSIALMDTLSWREDTVQLTLGLRRQHVRNESYDSWDPAVPLSAPPYSKHANSPAAALLVKATDQVSLYANYIEGLSHIGTPPPDAENYKDIFPPVKTRQKELGAKWDGGSLAGSLSAFEIEQPNAVRKPGTQGGYLYLVDGRQRNRGLELSVFGSIDRRWRVLGGATWTEAKQVRTEGGSNDGKDALGVPRWIANLGVEWDLPALPGLTLSARVVLTGEQYANADNTLKLPGWTRWDAGVRYVSKAFDRPLVLRANVQNLADRSYWEGVAGPTGVRLSPPRSVTLSASVDF